MGMGIRWFVHVCTSCRWVGGLQRVYKEQRVFFFFCDFLEPRPYMYIIEVLIVVAVGVCC